MYKFNIVNCSQKLTEMEINEIEAKIGMILPVALRTHYLRFNGGKVEGARYLYIKQNANPGEPNGFSLTDFFPIKYKVREKQELLEDVYKELVLTQKIISENFLPIGYDISGWPICYKIDDGCIFGLFREDLDENGNEKLVYICNSLDSFINGMLTDEEFEDML